MRSDYLVLLAFVLPAAVPGQNAPIEPFQQWAPQHVHPISSVDQDTQGNADLRALTNIVGDAHVVAFGEPFHGGHEPLAMRNRLIRYAVSNLGFTAIALETALSTSKRLYDHVLGKTTETDSALEEASSYGLYPEDFELIGWLRSYNHAQPPARKVRLYGIDLTGQYFPYAFRSVEMVLTYMDHADPALGSELRKQYADVISVFRSDKYVKLTPAEKDAITGKIQDMVALLRRERIPLTAATSGDEYEWALREALNAAQDDAYLRSLPSEFDLEIRRKSPEKFQPSERWEHNQEMRELSMADNVQWVQQRESSRGKILFFAHNGHVQTSVDRYGSPSRPVVSPTQRFRPTGMYLRSALQRDMVVIGTYYGRVAGFPVGRVLLPPDTAGMDSLLSSLSIPRFLIDLRELPGAGILHDWFQAAHETRAGGITTMVAPLEAYDAILFIDTITPTPAPPKP
jgi:erythromycin esterase